MAGYSENEHILSIGGNLYIGGGTPSNSPQLDAGVNGQNVWTISPTTFTPTVAAHYAVGQGVGIWNGGGDINSFPPFVTAATVTKLVFEFGGMNAIGAPGTSIRLRRMFYSESGPTNGDSVVEAEFVMPAMPVGAHGNIVIVGINRGTGFEVSPGDLLFIYAKARPERVNTDAVGSALSIGPNFSSLASTPNVSLFYTPREVGPSPWSGLTGPIDKPVRGSLGKIYTIST